jgi:flagellar biosynthesis/type III secretory pathway protein FliH
MHKNCKTTANVLLTCNENARKRRRKKKKGRKEGRKEKRKEGRFKIMTKNFHQLMPTTYHICSELTENQGK